jgi:hypothetical protein
MNPPVMTVQRRPTPQQKKNSKHTSREWATLVVGEYAKNRISDKHERKSQICHITSIKQDEKHDLVSLVRSRVKDASQVQNLKFSISYQFLDLSFLKILILGISSKQV